MQLPEAFTNYTRQLMGESLFSQFMRGMDEPAPVSIRLNPLKAQGMAVVGGEQVPWCPEGYYLSARPQFTFDPLLHAGCYYVQEAASMFVAHVLRSLINTPHPIDVLDLCAAPGGKSTAAISVLPAGSRLTANDPIRQRANVLNENIRKWGFPNCTVTNLYPRDFKKSKQLFDVVIADVPCSGEGMFRKDPKAIEEWSTNHVERCWRLQRDIIGDIWGSLKPGGLMIYSTCTFNTLENEENVRWICQELGAQLLPVATEPDWHITGSLLPNFHDPVYRFIPGVSRGEGLFMAVLEKRGEREIKRREERGNREEGAIGERSDGGKRRENTSAADISRTPVPPKGVSAAFPSLQGEGPGVGSVTLNYKDAIAYLRGEALILSPEIPRGIVEVSFLGHPLGTVKNLGSRANNLYPKEWRIKTTHIPDTYTPILTPNYQKYETIPESA